jgi:hypothetical protein
MAKQGIDPSFQAAPFLGESSHDPIEFVRRNNLAKYQASKQRQQEMQRNTSEGLEKLMVDFKGLYDQDGVKEVLGDHDKIIGAFLELNRKGLNVTTPKTSQEILAFKAITDALKRVMEKVDVLKANKEKLEGIHKAVQADTKLGLIDTAATYAGIDAIRKSKGGILDKKNSFDNLLVIKPQLTDMYEYVKKNEGRFPLLDTKAVDYVDAEGVTRTRQETLWTPDKVKESRAIAKQMYQEADEKVKRSIAMNQERIKQADPKSLLAIATPEEYFIDSVVPPQAQKFSDKAKGTGGGLGITLFGQKMPTEPAIKNNNNIRLGDRDYTEHYDFNVSKPLIGISMSDLGAEVYDLGKWVPASKEGGLVTAQLNFYDPKTDSFIFTSTGDASDAGVFKKQTFSVPRANLGKEVDELPIKKDDGKVGKLKDIYGKASPATTKKFPVNWSKPATPYIPKTK